MIAACFVLESAKPVHRTVRSLSQSARERIGDECPVKERIKFPIQRMMKQTVTNACFVNVARFWVRNPEMLVWPVPICAIVQIRVER